MLKKKGMISDRVYTCELKGGEQIKIQLETKTNGNNGKNESFVLDKSLATQQWHFMDIQNGSDMKACIENQKVTLTGLFHNKAVSNVYDMTGKLWLQMGEINLATFAISSAEEIHYYGIGTGNGRGALEMTEFTSKKAGTEKIEINGTSYECTKILTYITKYAFIWTGIGWYDSKTGNLLKYVVKGQEMDAMELTHVTV